MLSVTFLLLVSATCFFFQRAPRFFFAASIFGFATPKSPCTTIISPMSLVLIASVLIHERHSAVRKSSSCVSCSFVMLLCTSVSDLFLDSNSFSMLSVSWMVLLAILTLCCISFSSLLFIQSTCRKGSIGSVK